MPTDDEILDRILAREGGYVHHPADPGRATKFGITQATLSHWRQRDVTADEVAALTADEARAIYTAWYVAPFADLPDRIREHAIDIAVHSGVGTARILVQRAGRQPIRLVGERLRYLGRLVRAKPSLSVFLVGWIERCLSFLPFEED